MERSLEIRLMHHRGPLKDVIYSLPINSLHQIIILYGDMCHVWAGKLNVGQLQPPTPLFHNVFCG